MSEIHQISFLPWTELKTAITIGPVTFWPWPDETAARVHDAEMRSYLEKYFNSYVDNTGQPIRAITVCTYEKNFDLRPLNEIEREDLRNCCDVLIFATIAPQVRNAVCGKNRTFGPPSSDAFELITQNFQLDSDEISVRAGTRTSGGWKIGQITFPRPWSLGGSFGTPSDSLIGAFHKCFEVGFPENLRKRLLRVLEWFRLSHTENEQTSELSKIVMMGTAFEILLQFPRNNKGTYFVSHIETNIVARDSIKETRPNKKGARVEKSLAGWWASDFYGLRSRIVHGDPVTPSDLIYRDWITYAIVADLVLLECIEREFLSKRLIGENVYSCFEKITSDTPEDEKKGIFQLLARWFLGFRQTHEALGWSPPNEPE